MDCMKIVISVLVIQIYALIHKVMGMIEGEWEGQQVERGRYGTTGVMSLSCEVKVCCLPFQTTC